MDRPTLLSILFRHRSGLPILLAAPVVIAALRGGGIERRAGLAGIAIVAAGVLLRLLAVRRIGRGARVHRPHASAGLLAVGPYRWSRNPLYLAAALMLCGLGLLAGAGWTALLLLPATGLAYMPVVLAEERALDALFGEHYRRYLASVPRWIGWPQATPGDRNGALVSWREVFRREKWLVPGGTAAVLATAAVRSEVIPLPRVAHSIGLALNLDLGVIVGVAAGVAVAANALKVELHQRRRSARRSVPAV